MLIRKNSLIVSWLCLCVALATPHHVVLAATGDSIARDQTHPSQVKIRIDSSHPVLNVYRDGQLLKTFHVALGKPSTPSPIGKWKIIQKQRDWGGGFGTRWLGLNVPWGTYGIHGTNRPGSIGHFASNGCIRMNNQDVEQLYEMIPIGTPVTITGDPLLHRRVLSMGKIGADVQLVQQRLAERGYFSGECDGRYGPATQFCVSLYELAHNLPMDAVVGEDDYRSLALVRQAHRNKPS